MLVLLHFVLASCLFPAYPPFDFVRSSLPCPGPLSLACAHLLHIVAILQASMPHALMPYASMPHALMPHANIPHALMSHACMTN